MMIKQADAVPPQHYLNRFAPFGVLPAPPDAMQFGFLPARNVR